MEISDTEGHSFTLQRFLPKMQTCTLSRSQSIVSSSSSTSSTPSISSVVTPTPSLSSPGIVQSISSATVISLNDKELAEIIVSPLPTPLSPSYLPLSAGIPPEDLDQVVPWRVLEPFEGGKDPSTLKFTHSSSWFDLNEPALSSQSSARFHPKNTIEQIGNYMAKYSRRFHRLRHRQRSGCPRPADDIWSGPTDPKTTSRTAEGTRPTCPTKKTQNQLCICPLFAVPE